MKFRRMFSVIGAALLALGVLRGARAAAKPSAPRGPRGKKEASEGPLQNMKFRNLGPAVGGGRVTSVAGIPGDPNSSTSARPPAASGRAWTAGTASRRFSRSTRPRSARSRSRLPIRACLGRNGGGKPAQRRDGRPRRLLLRGRRQFLALHGARGRRADLPRPDRPVRSEHRPRRGARPRLGAQRRPGRVPHDRRRARAGRRSSSWTTRRAPASSSWRPATRRSSSPGCGRCGGSRGSSWTADRAPASTARPTAARPGRS